MEQTVICTNVSKQYRQDTIVVQALSGIDLAVPKGDFICLSGPSGSGKTTLLNLIGGLDMPSSGEITVAGRRVDLLSKGELASMRLRHLGFVFQAFNLIPVLTAYENVAFVLQLQGMERRKRRARAQAMLKEVGLEGLENRRPAELSGGQQQRVAVARAMVSGPSLVLADEPTANLDSQNGKILLELMRKMNEKHSATFIIATHEQLVMDQAKRLIHLHDGRIVSDTLQR